MSNDAGETWTLTSNDNNIRQRAWYYTKIFVDPKNENLVYAPNVNFMRSRDGGKTFQVITIHLMAIIMISGLILKMETG